MKIIIYNSSKVIDKSLEEPKTTWSNQVVTKVIDKKKNRNCKKRNCFFRCVVASCNPCKKFKKCHKLHI